MERLEQAPEQPEKEQELTSAELSEACSDKLSDEQLEELQSMPFDAALGLAFSYLIEAGVDDPEAYLVEKGILE